MVLLEPLADGAVYADVEVFLLGLKPLVIEDLASLIEEVFPELAVGERFRGRGGFGNRADVALAFVFLQGRDGDFEEFDGLGREINLRGGLGGVRRGDEDGAAAHDVLTGHKREILAAIEVEGGSTGVNLSELRLGNGDADRGLVFGTLFHHSLEGKTGCLRVKSEANIKRNILPIVLTREFAFEQSGYGMCQKPRIFFRDPLQRSGHPGTTRLTARNSTHSGQKRSQYQVLCDNTRVGELWQQGTHDCNELTTFTRRRGRVLAHRWKQYPEMNARTHDGQPAEPAGNGLLNKLDVAQYLGVSVGTVDNQRRRGKLRAIKVGSKVRFRREDLEIYLESVRENMGGAEDVVQDGGAKQGDKASRNGKMTGKEQQTASRDGAAEERKPRR